MNKKSLISGAFLVFVLAILALTGGNRQKAQANNLASQVPPQTIPGSEQNPATKPQTPVASAGDPRSAQGTTSYKYLSVTGAGFIPSGNAMTWTYGNGGCISPGSSGYWRANLNLPDGSTIKAFYIGFYNNPGSTATTGFLNKFSTFDDSNSEIAHLNTLSQVDAGAGYRYVTYATALNEPIDNMWTAYMFTWSGANPASVQLLCSMQVAYTPPSVFGIALPLIKRP